MFELLIDPFLPFIIIIGGFIGIVYGIDKLRKSAKRESDFLKYIALGTSLVIGIVNLLVIIDIFLGTTTLGTDVHWLTILLIFIAGSTMLADPLKDTPIAAMIAIIAFGGLSVLLLIVADFSEGLTTPSILGVEIPLWLLILILVGLVAVIFALTFVTEFTVDRILEIISWSPIVVIFSALLVIQGILILFVDIGGIWEIVPL